MALFGVTFKRDDEDFSEYITRVTRDLVLFEIADEEAKSKHPNVCWEKDGRHIKWMKLLEAHRKGFYYRLIDYGICEEAAKALAFGVHGSDVSHETYEIYRKNSWSHRNDNKE